ncbi:MAG TPA: threonine--tRNA ligase [Candidatus Jacksonbacteria bacterium]|nr:MAG: Threonine-tRNA ligase [Parcubacteria group bacterium GW2011_GWC2_44_22]HCE49254.1 threonine--tRNA ligase [Candidatus Jacksonbacteria bacterium]
MTLTLMPKTQSSIDIIRHSLAHLMAAAVKKLYGNKVHFGIGPTIENGFYYDIDFAGQTITDQDLPKIEQEMQKMIKQNLDFVKQNLTVMEAKKIFRGDPYKTALLKDIEKFGTTEIKESSSAEATEDKQETRYKIQDTKIKKKKIDVTIYKTGDFVDLCRGPHIKNTKELANIGFKLTKLAGAYWRGDEKNKMLTRIYGLAFLSKPELAKHLQLLAEAERRDHRKLGKELELFSFHDEGPGIAFWHDQGLTLRNKLIEFWREEHRTAGYSEISTPIILNESLWQTSGHMKNYRENMYFTEIDEQRFVIKPMNCPGGLLMYQERPRSYRELPLRVAELGLVHRHERAGVLHGLFRVRSFTQDDAHIYCTPEQIVDELKGVIKLTQKIYRTFGFDYHLELSTRPKKYIGDIKIWDKAEATLKKVLTELKLTFKINPGDGAFYGPKIDSHIKDSIGRTWQCGTVQLDFAQPENFKLEYIDKTGQTGRPVMLHRTIYGSLERFIGILTEHYAGAFPVWLTPVQIIIVPVGDNHRAPAERLKQLMITESRSSIRVEVDASDETVGYKIRQAAARKIPYTIVIGDKEIPAQGAWTNDTQLIIRRFGQKETFSLTLAEFIKRMQTEIDEKK